MCKTTFIYSLSDPRTGEVRYIGKANNPKMRLRHHLCVRKKDCFTKTRGWIISLKNQGLVPLMEIVDEVEFSTWDFWEMHYISLYKSWGFTLTNHQKGGYGGRDFAVFPEETKLKMRLAHLGVKHSPEAKEKQPDPKALEAMAKEAEIMHNNWEKFVDSDLVNKITKFNVPVNDKGETFDFDISEQDRKEVGDIMKALPKDTNAFFGQFVETDENGNQKSNPAALYQLILKGKNFEKAIALASKDAASKEALRLEKEAKNTNFAPGQAAGEAKVYATIQEAQAAAVQAKKL